MDSRRPWVIAAALTAVIVYAAMWVGYVQNWVWLDAVDTVSLRVFHDFGVTRPGWVSFWVRFCIVFGPNGFRVMALALIVFALLRRNLQTALFLVISVPSGGLSRPTPTANAAALAEWPDGREFDVGIRRARRTSGTRLRFGRGRFHNRLATWLVTRLVTANVATPCPAPRRAEGEPAAARAAAIASHSLEWSAARVRMGIALSNRTPGDSATASNTSRSRVPSPRVI